MVISTRKKNASVVFEAFLSLYEIKIEEGGKVKITMTLTAPACPVAGEIIMEVESKVRAIDGITDVHVHLTFDPPWTKDMMTEEAKLELGFL